MTQHQALNWLDFQQRFSSEQACRDYLFKMHWPEGFQCPMCNHSRAYEVKKRRLFECTQCGYQASVTAGTIMHKTRTPLLVWFWAIYLVASDKRGTSAAQISKQFGISYQTAWLMLHKIRKAMRDRDARYMLAGIVEIDDTMFGAPKEGGKRGRGSDKIKAVVSLSITETGSPLYLKMQVVEDLQASTLSAIAGRVITPNTIVSTDLFRSYSQLGKNGYTHFPQEFNHRDDPGHLKWLHTIIGNAKAFITGTYHGLASKHMQAYLDEYCYRFNHRHFEGQLFNRLLNACVSAHTVTYDQLVTGLC